MGLYHSDVCLVLSARGLEDLNCRIEAMDKDSRLAVVDLLASCNKYEEHDGTSIHFWKSLKWYESSISIGSLMEALRTMSSAGYYFLEVCEEGTNEWMGDLDNVFMPLVAHSIIYTSMQPVPPTRYASVGWTVEDLTYRYDVSKSVARDILLAVSEELQYAMRRAGWEVINAAMAKK